MAESIRERYTRWQLYELLNKYSGLQLAPNDYAVVLRGDLAFRATGPDGTLVDDAYSIEIRVPAEFPSLLPRTHETKGRIPRKYHKLEDGSLCLGAPTALRMKLKSAPSLLVYLESFVIPYLYGHSIYSQTGVMPFGELDHGDDGIRQYIASLFSSVPTNDVEDFLRLASMNKRHANKWPCPCGSGKRLGRCHNRRVNGLRRKVGRKWFREEYRKVKKGLSDDPEDASDMRRTHWQRQVPEVGIQAGAA